MKKKYFSIFKAAFIVLIISICCGHLFVSISNSILNKNGIFITNTDYYNITAASRYIFPSTLEEKGDVIDYKYVQYGRSKKEILLIMKYSNEELLEECNRLSTALKKYGIQYSDTLMHYPGYILKYYVDQNLYEYALIDQSNNTLIYVYIYGVNAKSSTINLKYLPMEYLNKTN